jgi:hypothetical protein
MAEGGGIFGAFMGFGADFGHCSIWAAMIFRGCLLARQ